jgi:hypothetical protein
VSDDAAVTAASRNVQASPLRRARARSGRAPGVSRGVEQTPPLPWRSSSPATLDTGCRRSSRATLSRPLEAAVAPPTEAVVPAQRPPAKRPGSPASDRTPQRPCSQAATGILEVCPRQYDFSISAKGKCRHGSRLPTAARAPDVAIAPPLRSPSQCGAPCRGAPWPSSAAKDRTAKGMSRCSLDGLVLGWRTWARCR